MELTREYLEVVDSINLQHSGCDCEVKGEWFAQDGDATLIIDKCECSTGKEEVSHSALHNKPSPKLPKSYAETERLFLEWWHLGSRSNTLSRKNMQVFYNIVVGNNGR